jgi:predicted LPLAT superfamily acyltransferase
MKKIPLWSSRSLGGRLQHHFFYLLIHLRMLCLARAFIYIIVLWYTFNPNVRRRSGYYLKRIFPDAGWWRMFMHSYRLNLSFAFSLLDRSAAGISGYIYQTDSAEAAAAIQQVLNQRQGLVLITAHFGSMQSAMAELKNFNSVVNLCLYKDSQDIDLHYFEHNNKSQINIIYADQPFGGAVEMLAALTRGEIVCFAGDRRLYASDPALAASFLGGRAMFPYMPYALAAKVNCPVAIVFLPRIGHGKFKLHLADIFKVKLTAQNYIVPYQQAVNLFAKHLESIIQKFPYQFFVFFDMWSDETYDNSGTVETNNN